MNAHGLMAMDLPEVIEFISGSMCDACMVVASWRPALMQDRLEAIGEVLSEGRLQYGLCVSCEAPLVEREDSGLMQHVLARIVEFEAVA